VDPAARVASRFSRLTSLIAVLPMLAASARRDDASDAVRREATA
jgi:hypothetical protein